MSPERHDFERARIKLGVPTQVRMAELLGVSPVQYRRIIAGNKTSRSVLRLVQAYLDGYRPADWPIGKIKKAAQP